MDRLTLAACVLLFAVCSHASYYGRSILWDGTTTVDVLSDSSLKVRAGISDGTTPVDVLADSSLKVRVYGLIDDSTARAPRIDRSTGALQTIDYAHHEVHVGSSYFAFKDTSVNSGDSLVLLIRTPNTTKWAHFGFEVIANGEIEFTLIEGVTVSDTGTAMTEFNANRNSLNAATVAINYTPTVSGGTRVYHARLGSGRNAGEIHGTGEEIILAQNAAYKLRAIARATPVFFTVYMSWYEHTDKD